MTDISQLAPQALERVIDLVKAAGVNVADWKNYQGGEAKEATNPKYCYEWSFVEPNKVVVLNLWQSSMQENNGRIFQDINMRQRAEAPGPLGSRPVWANRARRMDQAIHAAYLEGLPVRVIVCDGERRDPADPYAKASKVKKRSLDSMPWTVAVYDPKSGQGRLTRDEPSKTFVDQFDIGNEHFDIHEPAPGAPQKHMVSGAAFNRSADVRKHTLKRASGKCEYCSSPGFVMKSGNIYLETHHVVPLGEGGPDIVSNVAALCPNHHREAHHGESASAIRENLIAYLADC